MLIIEDPASLAPTTDIEEWLSNEQKLIVS
jgi:hypothetical protein